MFGIDIVGSAFRLGGAAGAGVWAAHPIDAQAADVAKAVDSRRKLMGAVGAGLLLLSKKLPAAARPAAVAMGAGCFAIYCEHTLTNDAGYSQAIGEAKAPVAPVALGRQILFDLGIQKPKTA